MVFVCPGLGLYGHNAGGRLSELRTVVLRRNLGFADRFEIRVDDDDPEDRIAVLRAVELVPGAAEVLAVDLDLGRSLRVLARRVLPLQLLRTGSQKDELREVAVEDGQLRNLPLRKARGHVGAVRLEQLSLRSRYCDGIAHLADFQADVHFGVGVDINHNRRNDRSLEPGHLDPDFVVAGQQALLRVQSRLVGYHRIGSLPTDTRDGDGRSRHDRSRRILDGTTDAAIHRLSPAALRQSERQEKDEYRPDHEALHRHRSSLSVLPERKNLEKTTSKPLPK